MVGADSTTTTQQPEQTNVTGTTLPRDIMAQQDWPQALIEDYDAKGRQIASLQARIDQLNTTMQNLQSRLP